MNRLHTALLGPEIVLALLTGTVFLFCARHGSFSPRDVTLLERLLWLLPVIAVILSYATLLVPGAKSWWWLTRVNLSLFLALMLCAERITDGLGAPGGGPKNGGMGLLLVICLGIVFGAIANGISIAVILAEHQPAFAEWFRARRIIGSLLTALCAVPLGIVMSFLTGVALSLYVGLS